MNQDSQVIQTIINVIEESLHLQVDKESVHYMRLIRHLHFAIDRVKTGEKIEEPKKIALLLKEEYPRVTMCLESDKSNAASVTFTCV